jgi:anti-sigma B factor antagonist
MKVNIKNAGKSDIKIFEIEGEIDVYTSMDLKKEFNTVIDSGKNKLIVNLSNVSYMDSSGLGILVAILKKSKQENGNMKLIKLTPGIKKIFDLTKLTKFFEIFEEEDEAVKSF